MCPLSDLLSWSKSTLGSTPSEAVKNKDKTKVTVLKEYSLQVMPVLILLKHHVELNTVSADEFGSLLKFHALTKVIARLRVTCLS